MSKPSMHYDYKAHTPIWMRLGLGAIGALAALPLANLLVLGYINLKFGYSDELSLTSLGQLGDFFGGHTSAFAGSLSLLVVLFFTFHQSNQQRLFFSQQQAEARQAAARNFFLEGVNQITQWDIASPGCDQCMRLLDYYGRVALQSDDRELLLILNTVITANIRKNLQGENGSYKQTNYPYACEALERIRPLREEDGRALARKRESKA